MTAGSRYFLAEKNLFVELANKNRLPLFITRGHMSMKAV